MDLKKTTEFLITVLDQCDPNATNFVQVKPATLHGHSVAGYLLTHPALVRALRLRFGRSVSYVHPYHMASVVKFKSWSADKLPSQPAHFHLPPVIHLYPLKNSSHMLNVRDVERQLQHLSAMLKDVHGMHQLKEKLQSFNGNP